MSEDVYTVTLVQEGMYTRCENYVQRKCNTVLIRGPAGCYVVNPGSVWNKQDLTCALNSVGICYPDKEINGVICTDGGAENVGCLSMFSCADLMIVGYDIQKRGNIFLEHDFCHSISPYEFDENFCVVGTPGQRGHQVSLMVNGYLVDAKGSKLSSLCRISVTGTLFMDVQDAGRISFFDLADGNHGELTNEKNYFIASWRRSRQYVLDRSDWIVPAYGSPFEVAFIVNHVKTQFALNLKTPGFNLYSLYLYNPFFNQNNKKLTKLAVELCDLRCGEDVLEVGHGFGLGLKMASQMVAPLSMPNLATILNFNNIFSKNMNKNYLTSKKVDGQVTGIDISKLSHYYSKSILHYANGLQDIDLHICGVDNLPFLANSFDACFHVNNFFYWPSLSQSLQQIWRVLRPGGRIVTCFCYEDVNVYTKRGWMKFGRSDPLTYLMGLESNGFSDIQYLKIPVETFQKLRYDCILARKPQLYMIKK